MAVGRIEFILKILQVSEGEPFRESLLAERQIHDALFNLVVEDERAGLDAAAGGRVGVEFATQPLSLSLILLKATTGLFVLLNGGCQRKAVS